MQEISRYASVLTTGHWLSMKQNAKCQANVTDLTPCNDGILPSATPMYHVM